MASFLSRFNQFRTVVRCPSCSQKLRVPRKISAVIRVKCSSCQTQFDVQFKHPLAGFMNYDRTLSFRQNLIQIWRRFLQLPLMVKVLVFILIFSLFQFVASLFSGSPSPVVDDVKSPSGYLL